MTRLLTLALFLLACGPKPQPGPVGPQPDAASVCPGYTAEGLRCVACGSIGIYGAIDERRGVYCVGRGIGCADSKCQALPSHP